MATPTNEQLKQFYLEMLLGRRIEERIAQLYTQGKFAGFCHLYIGQEAVSTGCLNAIRKTEDYVITAYRDHVMPLVLGLSPRNMMAELFGKSTGCSGGKGGSMHMFSKEHRFLGGHGIVGGQAPIAAGVGWKIKSMNEDLVCLCFLGDAALNQGQFFEGANMAAIWDLPVVYIVENNLYGMGTPIGRTCHLEHLYDRAAAFGIQGLSVDGFDVVETYTKMTEIVRNVRETKRPVLVEIKTYRFRGHSVSDPQTYRSKAEIEEFRKLDPLVLLESRLRSMNLAGDSDFEQFEDQVSIIVDDAVEFAVASSEPAMSELFTDVVA